MDNKISVVLNTYNASLHLDRVLDSVAKFDEIVVCDMESTDDTLDIARKHGCRIVTFPKGEHRICEPARNTAIQSASNSWVLVIDADEIVPDGLREYLYAAIENPDADFAFDIPRINRFMGREIHGTPDYQLRFFRKDKTDWPAVIHANPKVDSPIKKIPRKQELSLRHLDDASVSERIAKMNVYTDYETPKRAHKKYGALKILVRPVLFFWKNYLVGGGYKDGKRGLLNAYLAAAYQTVMLAKQYEYKSTLPASDKKGEMHDLS